LCRLVRSLDLSLIREPRDRKKKIPVGNRYTISEPANEP
jgi:hypothetical protein